VGDHRLILRPVKYSDLGICTALLVHEKIRVVSLLTHPDNNLDWERGYRVDINGPVIGHRSSWTSSLQLGHTMSDSTLSSFVPPPGISIDATLGALQIGVSLSVLLLGILSLQVYYYLEHHNGDGLYIRGYVGIVWLFELLHTVCALHLLYFFSITNFGNIAFFGAAPWSLKALITGCGILDVAFQTFCGLRIRLLSKRWEVPVLCWGLAITQFGLILTIVIKLESLQIVTFFSQCHGLFLSFLAVRTFMDLVGPVFLWYNLRKSESHTSLSARRYALLVIETGCIVFLIEFCSLATGVWSRGSFYWLAIAIVRAKVLANCIMTSLNSRHLWNSTLPLVEFGKKNYFVASPQTNKNPKVLDIMIEKSNSTTSTQSIVYSEQDQLELSDSKQAGGYKPSV